jgi:hypothetical protein
VMILNFLQETYLCLSLLILHSGEEKPTTL